MQISINANRCEPSPMRKFHPYAVKAAQAGKKIYHLTDTGNEIRVIDGITGAEQRTIEVNRAEPHFRKSKPGKVTHLFYIPSCKGLAMFDSNGNLFLIPAERQGTEKGKNDERAIIFQRDQVL